MSAEKAAQKKTAQKKGDSKAGSSARKKKVTKVLQGVTHVKATFNNTLITVTDMQGNALGQASSGQDFKGSRKSTPFAAQVAAEKLGKKVREVYGMVAVSLHINGPGPGREAVIKTFIGLGFKIIELRDITPIPHNGPRQPKERRV